MALPSCRSFSPSSIFFLSDSESCSHQSLLSFFLDILIEFKKFKRLVSLSELIHWINSCLVELYSADFIRSNLRKIGLIYNGSHFLRALWDLSYSPPKTKRSVVVLQVWSGSGQSCGSIVANVWLKLAICCLRSKYKLRTSVVAKNPGLWLSDRELAARTLDKQMGALSEAKVSDVSFAYCVMHRF